MRGPDHVAARSGQRWRGKANRHAPGPSAFHVHRRARELKKPIIWGIGGHVVKTGLAPILIDLMSRGFLSAVAANGSVLVHDAEIGMVGSTSEDVDSTLGEGVFGGADETSKLINGAATIAAKENIGLGEAVGRSLLSLNPKNADYSARGLIRRTRSSLFQKRSRC